MAKDLDRKAELTEHLAELRGRLIRSIIYVAVGAIVAWVQYDKWLYNLLVSPMMAVLKDLKSTFLLTSFPEAFMIRLQICIVAGLILASPLVTYELWAFVSPGLTANEKRPAKWIFPLALVLFCSGVSLCYFILPAAFHWFASYVPKGAELKPTVQGSILFSVKMLFMFGVVFELPVVLMLLAKVGIVNSRMLRQNWRIAMVLVSVVAAVTTPSNDAFSMLMMAVPVAVLYFLSIFLVKLVEGSYNVPRSLGKLFGKARK